MASSASGTDPLAWIAAGSRARRGRAEASRSADAAASSAARKYAAAIGFIDGVPSGRWRLRCLAIWRKARASAGVLYPCRDRRCSRSRATSWSSCSGSMRRSSSPSTSGVGVGQPATPAHHRVKTVVMVGVEREEQRHDRVPRVGPDRATPDSRRLRTRGLRRGVTSVSISSSSLDAGGAIADGSKTRTYRESPAITRCSSRAATIRAATVAPVSTSTSSHSPKRSASNCSSRPG